MIAITMLTLKWCFTMSFCTNGNLSMAMEVIHLKNPENNNCPPQILHIEYL